VDVIVTVAAYIVAEFLEVSSLAHLPAGMNTKITAIEKEGSKMLSFGKEIGIDPDFGIDGQTSRHGPKAEWRCTFNVAEIEEI
jgi:hypothetical protein